MKTIIHIDRHILARNHKRGENKPPVTVKTYKSNIKCHEVFFEDGFVIHRPEKPLPCGAKVWIETAKPVTIIK